MNATHFIWESGHRIVVQGGEYELVRKLGQGATSEVWLALLTAGGVCQQVVLKRRPEEPGELPQIDEELEVGRRLQHENIIRTYGSVQIDDRACLVLEYVEGRSVKELLAEARSRGTKALDAKLSCHVVAAVADALAHAHELTDGDGQRVAIVHRDVKPSNLMVAWSGQVKLLDFGVAKSKLAGRDETRVGKAKGTCGYQSPEQVRNEGPLDGRSDLFSLGIVLVELLTGKRPFAVESEFGTEEKIAQCEASDVEAATEQIAPGLREICRRALAKDPANRFQSGGELSRELREYLVRQGTAYGARECARDVQDLVGGPGRAEDTVPAGVRSAALTRRSGAMSRAGKPPRMASAVSVALAVLAGAVGSGFGLGGSALLRGKARAIDRAPATAPIVASGPESNAGGRCEAESVAAAAEGTAPVAQTAAVQKSVKAPEEPVLVVRPKRRGKERPADARGAAVRVKVASRVAGAAEAPEGTMEPGARGRAARGRRDKILLVVARGTVLKAKLMGPIDASRPGFVEATVTENVLGKSGARVPAGSAMVCYSRREKEWRVEVSCSEIRTETQDFIVDGMAAQGEHLGLRVVDGWVPAGVAFVVYVSGSVG